MSRTARVIQLPKPDRTAFSLDRTLESNTLLDNQFQHFRAVDQSRPPELRTGIDASKITTQVEASKYIAKVTELLLPKVKKAQ
jgi:hypothetical protein